MNLLSSFNCIVFHVNCYYLQGVKVSYSTSAKNYLILPSPCLKDFTYEVKVKVVFAIFFPSMAYVGNPTDILLVS